MIHLELVRPLYIGQSVTYWRYGDNVTVRRQNANGVWCCLTHLKQTCDCVLSCKMWDTLNGRLESL